MADEWQDSAEGSNVVAPAFEAGPGDLVLNIDGYEGPLDILLTLARNQKVDLRHISILQLAEQYLEFVAEARRIRLELAADYLVMAAWLAYLKSRLLLPEEEEDEPSAQELSERLAFRLLRLEAMRERAAELMSRNRAGRDVFLRGMPEGVTVIRKPYHTLGLYELLRAYAIQQSRVDAADLHFHRKEIVSIEDALQRLSRLVGDIPDWATLESFLPKDIADPHLRRSALASTFSALLEIARQGRLELKQSETFGPLMLRSRNRDPDDE
ncbi:MAG: ScpA family protein [Alphaproteobacteria bacterium]|nr:ScpA family protein [Alphaproteobacteria bacterium]